MMTSDRNEPFSREELLSQLAAIQSQIDETPHAFQLVAQRGVVLGMLNRWVAARADFDRAARLSPRGHQHKTVIYRMRGMAKRVLGQFPDALTDLDRALARTPDPSTRSERADVLRSLGRLPEALAEFDVAIAESDSDVFAFLGRGHIRYALGDHDEALRDYNRALALAPHDPAVLVARAQLYRDYGRTSAAKLDLRSAERFLQEQIARDSDDAEALNALAWLYTATIGNYHTEALALSNRTFAVLDEADQRASYITTRAWTLLQLGRPAEARPLLERAAVLNPFDADIRARLQRAQDAEGDE